jgi:hypothetical protein
MSEREIEKGLDYGDNFNFVIGLRDLLVSISELKKDLTKD